VNRKRLRNRASLLAACLALLAGPATAQNLDLAEVGAALALPVVTDTPGTGDVTWTSILITNTSANGIRLGFQVISGDPDDDWSADSFDCPLSPNETTHFLIEPAGDDARIHFECSIPGATYDDPGSLNVVRSELVDAMNGIFFAFVQDHLGQVKSNDVLIGTATIVDFDRNTAFSVDAVPFQGGDILAQDGNREFKFNGLEYAQFPSMVLTQFHAPDDQVEAFLILFGLDGTTGSGGPDISVKVDFWNDDELPRDTDFDFDCFTIVSLPTIDSRFLRANLGSSVGHLKLTPRASTQTFGSFAHDVVFGNDDGVRRIGVHGWIFQRIATGGRLRTSPEPGGGTAVLTPPVGNPVSYGRNLYQNQFSLVPLNTQDVPTLNAG
jgi:hypothetical protein